jgi:amino acid transporter
MDEAREPEEETPKERTNRELIELLNELRIVLPGTTVLLGFLLAVPFAKGWTHVTEFQRDVFIVAFLSTALSVACLTAPTSYHRLRFHHGDKTRVIRFGNRLAIAGIAASAVSLDAVVLLVTDFVLSRGVAIAAAASLFAVVLLLWYVLPLWAAFRDRSAR